MLATRTEIEILPGEPNHSDSAATLPWRRTSVRNACSSPAVCDRIFGPKEAAVQPAPPEADHHNRHIGLAQC